MQVHDRLLAQASVRPVPRTHAGQHREQGEGGQARIGKIETALRDAEIEDRVEALLIKSPQPDDTGIIGRLERAQLEGADIDLLLAPHMRADVKFDERAQAFDRIVDAVKPCIERRNEILHMLADEIDQQLLLGCNMVVERSGLNADLTGEMAQAHGFVAVLEDQSEPGLADRLERLRAR